MTVYKVSEEFANTRAFSGIIFDCDGVLIDSSGSYDLGLVTSAGYFASLLGLSFDGEEYIEAIREIRKLGAFNNDWDSLAVTTAYLYSKSNDKKALDVMAEIEPLSRKLAFFESEAISSNKQPRTPISFADLMRAASKAKQGANRDELIRGILGDDGSLIKKVRESLSYPNPVGKSLLSTLFDEIVYGRVVFREMYGLDCSTTKLSNPGLIENERKLVNEAALSVFFSASGGNLGVITGRPRVPTIFTLGDTFSRWFAKQELCLFTGDYILDVDEVKPSPKPMIKVSSKLVESMEPILYVGDSGEDLLMVKNANKGGLGRRIYFAGIASSKEKAEYFDSQGVDVDCIVSDVNELASVVDSNSGRN